MRGWGAPPRIGGPPGSEVGGSPGITVKARSQVLRREAAPVSGSSFSRAGNGTPAVRETESRPGACSDTSVLGCGAVCVARVCVGGKGR